MPQARQRVLRRTPQFEQSTETVPMCGIAGLYGWSGEAAQSIVRAMCAALTHRGPDDDGYWVDGPVALGMRRLRIIDLATGHQPIFNEDQSVAVVYNGEIYNFTELREDLRAHGHRFYTTTDTEVIVHLYEEYGDACVEHLRGMWAFALWDRKRDRLLLSRDRLGIKPLYYWRKAEQVVFGSEIKAILRCPFTRTRLNLAGLHDYLTYLCVPGPGTIYEDIQELSPGHNMSIESGKVTVSRYWNLPGRRLDDASGRDIDIQEAGQELGSRIAEAVRISLVSDVPLGVFLSGGLDSALILAMMAKHSAGPIQTFTVGFGDAVFSEIEQARLTAHHFGAQHHEFVLDPPGADEVVRLLLSFDEPFADSSAFPTFAVSRMARSCVTVALSGDGGDEVFGGYNNYRADALAMRYRRLPASVRWTVRSALAPFRLDHHDRTSNLSKLHRILSLAELEPAAGHVWWLTAFSEEMKGQLYSDERLRRLIGKQATRYESLFATLDGQDFLNDCMAVDLQTVLPNDYLKKADRMSMANSVELRVPLLDHELVEFALRLPSRLKVSGWTTKLLLRNVMKPLVPQEILTGRKRGFSIPLSRWLREDWRDLTRMYLSEESIAKAGYFNWSDVKRLVDEHMAEIADHGKAIWTLLCFEIWRQAVRID